MALLLCSATLVGQPNEGKYSSLLLTVPVWPMGTEQSWTWNMALETCDICSKDLLGAVPLDLFSTGPSQDTYS